MIGHPFHFDVALQTDIGLKRASNEDSMISVLPEDTTTMSKRGAIFVVADGLGGHTKGDVASNIAVNAIQQAYYQADNDDITSILRDAVKHANQLIYQENAAHIQDAPEREQKSMGTTCVAAVFKDDMVYIANVGDSLAYLIRGEEVKQLAEDHTVPGEHPMISRCLGIHADVEVYTTTYQVQQGDSLILCTDGLHMLVSENEIRATVERYGSEESARRLVARANENGGPDNITAIVVKVA